MKKILVFTLILSQLAIAPLWSMGKKMKNPDANQLKEQNDTGQNSATDPDTANFKDQDRDTMNQTTGFSGQPSSSVEFKVNGETPLTQRQLDMKNQSNLSGQTGQKSSEALKTRQSMTQNQ